MREANIKRIVELWRQGKIENLSAMDKRDLSEATSVDLAPYERGSYSDDQPIYGDVTLGEIKSAKAILNEVPVEF